MTPENLNIIIHRPLLRVALPLLLRADLALAHLGGDRAPPAGGARDLSALLGRHQGGGQRALGASGRVLHPLQ